jgi:hypothetical protein
MKRTFLKPGDLLFLLDNSNVAFQRGNARTIHFYGVSNVSQSIAMTIHLCA